MARWFERSGARVIVGKAGLTETAYREIDLRLDEAYRNLPPYAMGRFGEIGSCDKEIV